MPTDLTEIELFQIENLIKNNPDFYQIIRNYQKKIISNINSINYVFVKKAEKDLDFYKIVLNPSSINIEYNFFDKITKMDWKMLWSKKIDYIEYQMPHIEKIYKILRNSINYYIGMAEIAIEYINNISKNNEYKNMTISHRRIITKNINNPLNIIVDYQSRDIAEYLKYLFIENKYDYYKISKLFKKLNLNPFSYSMIYGRMFYITFYFDLYDQIITKKEDEKEMKKIINRINEYEDYVRNIYIIIDEIKKIPEIVGFY